jgi:hypothetical protein
MATMSTRTETPPTTTTSGSVLGNQENLNAEALAMNMAMAKLQMIMSLIGKLAGR